MDKARAMLVGLGVVPAAFAAAAYGVCAIIHPIDPLMPSFLAMFTTVGGMIGGWVGAWMGYMTNQANSDRLEVRREYEEAVTRAERQPQPRSVEAWLRASGLPETRGNVWLFQIGVMVATAAFVAIVYWMIGLGFEQPHTLAHLPLRLRLLGAVVPFAASGVLWALMRRAVPALGVGLRYALIPQMVLWALAYLVCSLRAVGA